jgi:hypothetical protein
MGFETMGEMKVLALKGIEKQGHLWAVRYTRHHGRNVQDAIFFCDTADAAKAMPCPYEPVMDLLPVELWSRVVGRRLWWASRSLYGQGGSPVATGYVDRWLHSSQPPS